MNRKEPLTTPDWRRKKAATTCSKSQPFFQS